MEYLSKSDIITAALRELIIAGEFEAGAQLGQRELGARFGVSPTPVREALRRLESEGLIRYDVHRGATVIDATFGATEENFEVRAVLESLAAGLAATRISPAELDEIQSLHDELKARKVRDAVAQELNRRFHFRIYEASHAPLLLALLRLLWQAFPEGPQIVRPLSSSVKQHEAILDALRMRERPEVERLVKEHILSSIRNHPGTRGDPTKAVGFQAVRQALLSGAAQAELTSAPTEANEAASHQA